MTENRTEERIREEELQEERYVLAMERIRQIPSERSVPEPYRDFFGKMASYILKTDEIGKRIREGFLKMASMEELRVINREPYEDLFPENYEKSYGNPAYAVEILGDGYGQLLGFLYTELQKLVILQYENRMFDVVVILELYLELYNMFEEEELPSKEYVKESIYWYVSDYCDEMMEERIREMVDPKLDFAVRIIMDSDLSDLRYLYRYGEYITENELETAAYLNTFSQQEIDAMARTYTEGFRKGFELGRKDLSKKKTVNIRYHLGLERMVRAAVEQFKEMGLSPVIYRGKRTGYSGTIPNKQYDYDHKNDEGLYLDEDLVQRRLRAMQVVFDNYKYLSNTHAGPAVIETFGEVPFEPVSKKESVHLSPKQQKLKVHYSNESGQITNRYIIGEERSFTIISYPLPEIGENYREIFRETVKINTLDYEKYQKIQQHLIDALDQGVSVRVSGKNGNRTDLRIMLHPLTDQKTQTNFENCVADVNIPVGEVFTSPVLEGTTGILHVTSVYLNELNYVDLELKLKDGMIADYSCRNFDKEEDNRTFIEENLLFHHKTLPIGEFAIGTNTTAYMMAQKYEIGAKLPILIAEKMGPHFAMGDTCYSWSEDTAVYNPDGKEIIARDNEVSIKRKEDPAKAYFNCHTDITIPYHELGFVRVEKADGTRISLIEDGRFVLPGTEALNEPFDQK
ncbi:MAG: aminopeptidase [Lachnospiraceae bacterium]|nr:aminopeptidase [Lachnospiraceae bacterium]